MDIGRSLLAVAWARRGSPGARRGSPDPAVGPTAGLLFPSEGHRSSPLGDLVPRGDLRSARRRGQETRAEPEETRPAPVDVRRSLLAVVVIVVWLGQIWLQRADAAEVRLANGKDSHVDVTGLSAEELEAIRALKLDGDAWHGLLAVYVVPSPGKPLGPPILGS